MCGIAGIAGPAAERHAPALERMLDALVHRGPDGRGTRLLPGCALGHTRLAVIDLQHGAQPMFDATGVGITLNGEIYGFLDLREELDYPFRTHTDAEVVLALYERFGTGLLDRLPGMFAFALWDERRQELFCARDRFGERPFYWARGPEGEFVFASEIAAIVASGLVRAQLDLSALTHVLRRGYIHPTQTIYSNIHPLRPAHSLSLRDGDVRIERYWSMPDQREGVGLADAVEEFRERFERAISRQLVADVEVGALLSGGADSTTIVQQASRELPRLRTYSYGYSSESELPYARLVASDAGTTHSELVESAEDVVETICRLPQVFDEPFCDSAAVATWLISRQARRDVKILLAGEGADELLGGYVWWYRRPYRMSVEPDSPEHREHSSPLALHRARRARIDDQQIRLLGIEPIPWEELESQRGWAETGGFGDVLRADVDDFLAGDILVKTDRAAMAHGLELRAPFLDFDLATFCLTLPTELKVTDRADKLILREAFGERWPTAVRQREKQGFGAPIAAWMATESVGALCHELLDDKSARLFDVLSFAGARPLLDDPAKRWRLLVMALWFEAQAP